MCSALGRLRMRSRSSTARPPRILPGVAKLAFCLALVPLSAPRAKTDCSSLDVALAIATEFTSLECDEANVAGGGPSHTAEVIIAGTSMSFFVIHHLVAGVRTYFERRDAKTLLEGTEVFANIENWGAAPGGDKFMVARFRGRLKEGPDMPLPCFGFSRFSGHISGTTGYRHLLFGFYCVVQADDISDAEVRRLTGAVRFDFE